MSGSPGSEATGADPDESAEPSAPRVLLDDVEAYERAISDDATGQLAVCSPPFGGRDAILEDAAERLGTTVLELEPGAEAATVRSALGDGPIVVDGWQHLYDRRIGGFERLEDALQAVVASDDLVVAGWNVYAWTYLTHVRDVDRTFTTRVGIEATASDDLAALVLDRYEDTPTFVADESDAIGVIDVRYTQFEWRGRTVSVPIPAVVPGAVRAALTSDTVEPKDLVFERLAAVSDGNLGVATALWGADRREEVRPSDIAVAGADMDLDREEAFCLRIVLLKERVDRATLEGIVRELDRVLGRLRRDGLVSIDGDVVHLEPAAVPAATAETERWGFH